MYLSCYQRVVGTLGNLSLGEDISVSVCCLNSNLSVLVLQLILVEVVALRPSRTTAIVVVVEACGVHIHTDIHSSCSTARVCLSVASNQCRNSWQIVCNLLHITRVDTILLYLNNPLAISIVDVSEEVILAKVESVVTDVIG